LKLRLQTRKYGKKDTIQRDCEQLLKRLHINYVDTSSHGDGFGDLVIDHNRENPIVEIKTGKARLTEAEARFHATWKGPLWIIRSTDDLLWKLGFK
jgi:hypothetical protein